MSAIRHDEERPRSSTRLHDSEVKRELEGHVPWHPPDCKQRGEAQGVEAAHQFVTDETRWPILETSLKVGTVVLKRRGEDETGTQVDEGQLQPRDPIVR